MVDWSTLHSASASAWAPRRISMPTYPFQGERHWLADATAAEPDQAAVPGHLHPLVHVNSSTLHGQRFTSVYTGEEFFLRDHQVRGRPVLSGAACLELARAAVAASVDEPYRVSGIRNVAWTRPVTLHEPGLTVQVRLRPEQDGEVGFTILSPGDPATGTADTVHSEGVVHVTAQPLAADTDVRVDLPRLRETCSTPGPDADALYASAEARGISYGPGHQGVQQLWTGAGQALARIGLPQAVRDTQHAYGLHPSTLDAGLQACAGLLSGAAGEEPQLPFALDEVEILGPCPPEAWAWVRDSAGHEGAGLRRLDIDICDDEGRVRVRLKGVALRAHPVATTARELFAAPHWVTAVPAPATAPAPEGLVLVVELPDVAAALEAQGTVRVVRLSSGAPDVGRRYTDYALQVFDEVKRLLAAPAHHPVRVQLLAPAVDASLWTGLAAVVRSAGLENPRLLGQMVLVGPGGHPGARRVPGHGGPRGSHGLRGAVPRWPPRGPEVARGGRPPPVGGGTLEGRGRVPGHRGRRRSGHGLRPGHRPADPWRPHRDRRPFAPRRGQGHAAGTTAPARRGGGLRTGRRGGQGRRREARPGDEGAVRSDRRRPARRRLHQRRVRHQEGRGRLRPGAGTEGRRTGAPGRGHAGRGARLPDHVLLGRGGPGQCRTERLRGRERVHGRLRLPPQRAGGPGRAAGEDTVGRLAPVGRRRDAGRRADGTRAARALRPGAVAGRGRAARPVPGPGFALRPGDGAVGRSPEDRADPPQRTPRERPGAPAHAVAGRRGFPRDDQEDGGRSRRAWTRRPRSRPWPTSNGSCPRSSTCPPTG